MWEVYVRNAGFVLELPPTKMKVKVAEKWLFFEDRQQLGHGRMIGVAADG